MNLDPECLKNYRPISNTPTLSKIIEKAALSQMNSHLFTHSLHTSTQSGYKKNHSCETAVLKVINDIQNEVRMKNITILFMLDLSAAFDTIDHSILLYILQKSYGFDGKALAWLSSYLQGRTFSVKVRDNESNRNRLLYGVPQGSILGPVLFILYISELSNIAQQCGMQIHTYADDTNIYIGFAPTSEYSQTVSTIQRCLRETKTFMLEFFSETQCQ